MCLIVFAYGLDPSYPLVVAANRDEYYKRPTTKAHYWFKNDNDDETHEEHVGRIVGEVAPSILLSSVAESTCFFLGALTDMPAVRQFALYAGMALLIDFLMQVTCFVSLLALDMQRQEANR